jgi:hypothetical protein
VGGGITKELRNEISQRRNKLDATRSRKARIPPLRAIEQAVGVERDPDAWLNRTARERTRNARCQDNAVGTFKY